MKNSNNNSNKNLILLRGLTRGSGHWLDFPKLLSAEFLKTTHTQLNIELLELPGNGLKNNELSPTDPVEAINSLLEQSQFVKNNESFHLCGLSLGGMISLKIAEVYPQKIQSVTVINSSLKQYSYFYERLFPWHYIPIFKSLFFDDPALIEKKLLSITLNDKKCAESNFSELAEFSQKYPVSFKNFIRQLKLANHIEINIEKFKKNQILLQVLTSKKDRLVSYMCSLKMAKAFNSSIHIHQQAGHDLPIDDPYWLSQKIIEFIK